MKIFNNAKLFLLTCLLAFVGMISSCKKDDTTTSSKLELLSFGPTGAKHGDTLRFIGTNLQKVTQIDLTGASVASTSFLSQNFEEIKIIVPASTETGKVTLKTPEGDIVSKTILNLDVAIVVTSMTKEARPGENITIKGDFLNWVTGVTFNKDIAETTFVSKTISELVVKVPMNAQTGTLFISYSGTEPLTIETDSVLKVTLPMITGMTPNPVKHAGNVTITGTNLDLAKKVMFTGEPTAVTTFVSQTATQLVVKVPPSTTKGIVTLEAASGVKTTSASELDVVLPAITKFNPNPVDTLANLTITGTDLDLVSAISFVGVPAAVTTFVSQSPTVLVVKVPTGAITSKVNFAVLNSTLSVKSAADLQIIGSSVTPIIIYDEAITSAWNGWIGGGWGGTKDLANTAQAATGSKSVKIDFTSGGYGVPLQLGGANISLGGYTSLNVSIYGGAGSGGKSVNIGFNEKDGKTINIVEGAWTNFVIPLGQISAASTLTHLYMKNYAASGDFTIYVDNLGIY
ncbi:MAG: IPT/TIG domain-containing protein [Bacteroidota bacterium]